SDIKAFGSFSAEIKLYTGISANIAIEVVEA
ncbi:MAG: 50S ribosomal protein L9, partial [Oscillospiraceae bacterium]|nr:50S ribosomal protein L9 [Oscillospiraceae bacterium]